MSGFSRSVIWFNRVLLLAATFIMTMIALRTLRDPIGSTLPIGIVLNSPTAVTVVRVGFGGFPLGFAVALVGCLVSTKRLLGGLLLLASIMVAVTITRIQGIVKKTRGVRLSFANIPANVRINHADPHIGVRTKSFRVSGNDDDSIAHMHDSALRDRNRSESA